jgi:hypothetical protein
MAMYSSALLKRNPPVTFRLVSMHWRTVRISEVLLAPLSRLDVSGPLTVG